MLCLQSRKQCSVKSNITSSRYVSSSGKLHILLIYEVK